MINEKPVNNIGNQELSKNNNHENIKEYNELLENRKEVSLINFCEDYKNWGTPESIEFLDILLSRNDYAQNCTIILGETREAYNSPPGTSTVAGSLDYNREITPQAFVKDYTYERNFLGWDKGMEEVKVDLLQDDPGAVVNTAAHELAHTFTVYITASYKYDKNGDSSYIEQLNDEEQEFYQIVYQIYLNQFLPDMYAEFKDATNLESSYEHNLNEFIAQCLTSSKYSKYSQDVKNAFVKMYQDNDRRIISFSRYLGESI